MTQIQFNNPARLYLGRDRTTAIAQGAKSFRTAAQAIRFAIEEAAPVSLHGALLVVGQDAYSGAAIKTIYSSDTWPMTRKRDLERFFG